MLVDGDVARQQRERVGIAGRAHLQAGDLAHQILAGAQAHIAAPLGQDEALHQMAPLTLRQAVGQLLDADVLFDDQRARVHQLAAGLAPEQLLAERPHEALQKRVTLDQPDRPAVVDHRHCMQRAVLLEARENLRTRGIRAHRRDRDEQALGAAAETAGPGDLGAQLGPRALEDREHRVGRLQRRLRRGVCDEVALPVGDAQIAHDLQLGCGLDALGDDQGPGDLGDLLDRLQELELERIAVDALHEMHVGLDVLRPQLGPHAEAREAFAEIVDGDLEAERPVAGERGAHAREIEHRQMLGQLDHDALGLDIELPQQLASGGRSQPRERQALRAHVQKQALRQAQPRECLHHGQAAQALQPQHQSVLDGGPEQLDRHVQRGVCRTADQPLVAQQCAARAGR